MEDEEKNKRIMKRQKEVIIKTYHAQTYEACNTKEDCDKCLNKMPCDWYLALSVLFYKLDIFYRGKK